MSDSAQPRTKEVGRTKRLNIEKMHRGKRNLYLGIDIGSTSSDVVVLDKNNKIILSSYQRTKGKPIETILSQLERVFKQINPSEIIFAAATGSVGRFLAKQVEIQYVNEVAAQTAAINLLYPQLGQATVIEMGGQDSKLIFLSEEQGRGKVRDFSLNTVCAAGTGSFLDQQAQRLGIDIEGEFGELALQSENTPQMAGRCSVFAKSDMIHLQQQATPTYDILAGLCFALARNLKSNLGRGRDFVKPIIFTGGVAANIGVVRAIEQVFKLEIGELLVPKEHFFTGAIGAVLVADSREGSKGQSGKIELERLERYLAEKGAGLKSAPRREPLCRPSLPSPESKVYEHLLSEAEEPIDAYLGVDVGSISTNVAVIDEQRRVLTKAYLMTAGQPLEAVRRGLEIVGEKVAGKVKIIGVATTGSGRYLTGDFIGADVVINEITAQATGASIVNPEVDTIFEIGGQDSKYISLENGVVVDFEMNHACAAGTGSFLEEQAQRLGININEEFAQLAFESKAPVKLGERCTVFMESDLLSYQQQGAQTSDLVAGLSYSIVSNYLNRVVGRRRIGENICFQGGTAFNKAVWSAFEKVTGKSIMVPDHHEVTGAIGAAAIAAGHMKREVVDKGEAIESNFRGFENLVSVEYRVESFTCDHCSNHCEVKKVQLPDAEPLYYGSRCDRYNLKKEQKKTKAFDAFKYRREMLFKFAGLDGEQEVRNRTRGRIGIPMALVFWQLLPLFTRFFRALGFEVVLSGKTDKKIIHMGVEAVTAQPCFPVKVAYGHIADLIEKKADYIFIPSIVSMTSLYSKNNHNKLCPYVQSLGYQAKSAFGNKLGETKILTPSLHLGEGQKLLRKTFSAFGKELGVSAGAVGRALKEGFSAQAGFEQSLKEKGREILSRLGPDERLFVLVSRPYNGCDEGVNLQLSKKLTSLGAEVIPLDMLELDEAVPSDQWLHSQLYWMYGQKILRAAEIIKRDRRLFAIYLSNFSCGPDSFLLTFFKDIMVGGTRDGKKCFEASQKPSLQLELDEHSADAGVITRLEAFLESLKHYKAGAVQEKLVTERSVPVMSCNRERKLYIPYMSDASYGVAACFRSYGQPAEVIPITNEAALLQGRAFTTGKECLPCAITAGDMIKVLREQGPEKVAFFMPGGAGPCRFGMYNCMHRLILQYAGANDVPVISPNQDGNFYSELAEGFEGSKTSFMKDVWTAAVGIDLLQKLVLRLRPFAKDSRRAQEVYEKSVGRFVRAVEKHSSLSEMRLLFGSISEAFAAVELDRELRRPKIGIVGEIYVRNHPFANMNIIARLEKLGAACDLASLAEWIYYTNFTRMQAAWRGGRFRDFFINAFQDRVQHRIERSLAKPLEKRFGELAEEPIEDILEYAAPYIHRSFEGEAILSVGKMIEHHHHGVGGVVNVMPFSCMPSTVVSSHSMRVSADCDDMPILNLSFDGQEDATLTTRLEAFVEQVHQRQNANLTVSELLI